MKLIYTLTLSLISSLCNAQCYDRFTALSIYYKPSLSFGAEIGSMPSEGYSWGYIGGLNMGRARNHRSTEILIRYQNVHFISNCYTGLTSLFCLPLALEFKICMIRM
jgi:hypothetical protein